jgi:outer membrane receptor protein involved in Fe transport
MNLSKILLQQRPSAVFILPVFIFLLTVSAVFAQTSSSVLRGVVTDENQAIIPDAKLVLHDESGAKFETESDDTGNFSFGELKFGKYSLKVEKEGFTTIEREIVLNAATQNSGVTMAAGAVSESVTIVLDSAEAAVESTLKLPVSIHETPRSLTVIGEERIREQNFRQVSDVLNYVPGTTQNSYRNGSYHFYSRGYRMAPEDTRVDGFVGVNVGGGGFGASMFGVEEAVVLRGPAGLVYGQSGSPGGFINLVSKKPQDDYFTRVDLRGAGYAGNGVSFNERPMYGIDFDSTGKLFGSDRVLYRGLFTIENMNYFTRDTLDRNRYANASLTFKLDQAGRYTLTPSAQYVRYFRPYGGGIIASPSSSLSAALIAGDPISAPINEEDLSPLDVNLFGGKRIEETKWGGLDFRGIITEKLRVNAAYRYISFDTDINAFTPQAASAAQIVLLRTQNVVSRVQSKSLTDRNYNNFNADAVYEWKNAGWWRNTTQIGFYERVLDSRGTTASGSAAAQSPINIYTGTTTSPLRDNLTLTFNPWTRDTVWNAFAQNRTSLDNGRWNFTLGFNYGQNKPAIGARRKSGLIPNASVVFNATPELAVYASYSTSFNPTDPTLEDARGNRGTFDPTLGTNYEVGAKYDLFNRRIGLTFAVFQNQIENALVQSDINQLNSNNLRYYIPAGTRRSRGAEMTGEFQVRQDLRVTAGASYIEAIYKGFPSGTAVSSSPIPNSWAEKTPRWTYNFYTRYDRREGYLKGFGAGFGMNWQGKRLGSNGARTFASPDPLVLPAFTRVDTALFYRLNKHVNFAMNVENLFDEVIFVNASVGSSIEIAAPRTTTFRTTFNF